MPSFNFGASTISIKRDDFIKWAKENGKPVELTEELAREYLEATKKLLPAFARVATYDGSDPEQTATGFRWTIGTPPREKHRCIRVLKRPLVVAAFMKGDTTHKQFIDASKEATRAALASFGGTFDPACADLARAYYEPTHRSQGTPLPKPIHVPGSAVDFVPFVEAALKRIKDGAVRPESTRRTARQHAQGNECKARECRSASNPDPDRRVTAPSLPALRCAARLQP